MKKYMYWTLFIMFAPTLLSAQQQNIKGKIWNANTDSPISNVSIQLKNSKLATSSDKKGNFEIQAQAGDTLWIQHLSYTSKEVVVEKNMLIYLEDKAINLESILIKTKVLQDISQSTVIMDNIKSTTRPRNLGDLFRDIKGFGIQKRGAYASEPVFRAFKQEQLNIQLDGGMKIQNACPSRMDPITTHIISNEIDRIEVVRGPFTVRFGQNFGGIVNMVSKSPSALAQGLHGNVDLGYETNGGNYSTTANLSYREKKWDLSLNGEYRNYGNYKDGYGTKVPSSFRSTDYSAKLGYNPKENQRLQLSWRQSFGRDIDHAGLMMDSPYDDSFLAGIDYKVSELTDLIKGITLKGFYSEVDHLMTNDKRPSFASSEGYSNVFSTTYGGKAELVLSPSNSLSIFTGVDANIVERDGDRIRTVKMMNGMPLPTPMIFVDKIWQDSRVSDYGVFAEAKYRLNPNYTLTAGIRADIINAAINDPEEDFLELYGGKIKNQNETNLSGNLSLKYLVNQTQVQLALGRGVRTADMIERFINHMSVGVDPYEYVGNPYLKPEINNQVELSFNTKIRHMEFGASIFYSHIQDYIVPIVDESIPRKFMPDMQPAFAKRFINIDKAMQTGFELFWNYEFLRDLNFSSMLSYTYAKNKDYNEPLPQITPLTANAGLLFDKDKYWININARYVAAQKKISKSFMETASKEFATLDLSFGVNPLKNLSIGASVLNIFDVAYYEHLNFSYENSDLLSGRIHEPGRNFTIKAIYSF